MINGITVEVGLFVVSLLYEYLLKKSIPKVYGTMVTYPVIKTAAVILTTSTDRTGFKIFTAHSSTVHCVQHSICSPYCTVLYCTVGCTKVCRAELLLTGLEQLALCPFVQLTIITCTFGLVAVPQLDS